MILLIAVIIVKLLCSSKFCTRRGTKLLSCHIRPSSASETLGR